MLASSCSWFRHIKKSKKKIAGNCNIALKSWWFIFNRIKHSIVVVKVKVTEKHPHVHMQSHGYLQHIHCSLWVKMITNDIGGRMLAKIWALLKVPLNRSIASALKIPIPSRHHHHHYHHSDHRHHHYHHPDHHHIIIIVNMISFPHLPIWTLIFIKGKMPFYNNNKNSQSNIKHYS